MLLGDFETDSFNSDDLLLTWASWALFAVASVFLIIVMLNLLISIIGDSYADIQSNAQNSMYKELASLIYDNYFLTHFDLTSQTYIVMAKPDDEYIKEI